MSPVDPTTPPSLARLGVKGLSLVDKWAVYDQHKLHYFETQQDNIRADLYNGLADTLIHDDLRPDQTRLAEDRFFLAAIQGTLS